MSQVVHTVKVWGDDCAPGAENPYPLIKVLTCLDKQHAGMVAHHEWMRDIWTGVGIFENEKLIQGYGLTH